MDEAARSPASSSEEMVHNREAFADTLMDLKHRGCCVLVTGQVNERIRAAQSRRLFGQSDRSRQRVLLLTEATPHLIPQYLPKGITPTHASVTTLDYTDQVRDLSSTISLLSQPWSDNNSEESASMTEYGTSLYDAITDAINTESLRPGELRLGVATLGVLIDTDGLPATQAFVRAVRTELLAIHGIGHFHFPGKPGTETCTALRPFIDIHIELRKHHDTPEHRWHLLETDHSTSWIQLPL